MDNKLISIIIPVYNTETYIGACLDSVLEQTYQYIEVIVINDGSTDFSQKIIDKYAEKDPRVKSYIFPHEGLSVARNHGLSVATGDYLAFVDADDLLYPDALKLLLKIIKGEEADIVEGKICKGDFLSCSVKIKNPYLKIFNAEAAIEDLLYQKNLSSSMCGKIFRKELFNNFSFEKNILYEDLNLIYRIYENCNKIIYINIPVYFYRNREGSIINTWKTERLDVLKVTEKIEDYIAQTYPDIRHAATDRRLSANFNMFALCENHGEKDQAKKCWNIIKEKRRNSLFNPKVRIKNKGAIIVSYLGRHLFSAIARKAYR